MQNYVQNAKQNVIFWENQNSCLNKNRNQCIIIQSRMNKKDFTKQKRCINMFKNAVV